MHIGLDVKCPLFLSDLRLDEIINWIQALAVPMHLGLKRGPLCPII
jgi:hypothetical protein